MGRKQRLKLRPEGKKSESVPHSAEDFRHLLSAEDFIALMAELEKPLKTALRVNPMKVDTRAAPAQWSEHYGWRLSPVPYCSTGWRVEESPTPVSQVLEHRLGQFYIQDAASMLPVELFDWEGLPQPLVLDMAASPGGKTTHLSAKMRDAGLLLANDSSRDRLTALRLVLQNWGAVNSAVSNFPGERFGDWFPDSFDRVLLDAPCSMQGLRTSESHPMRPITVRERSQLSGRQARLLASALRAVRPGGQVVYSTCTLTTAEDEEVLQAVLDQFGSGITIMDTALRLPHPSPALAGTGERIYDPAIQGAARLWPHRYGTSGFFAALIMKNDILPGNPQSPPGRPLERAGLAALGPAEVRFLGDSFRRQFEFELDDVLQQYRLVLWRLGKHILALPEMLLSHLPDFPVQSAGLALGEETVDGFLLGHDWLVRFEPLFLSGRLRLEERQTAAWLGGEDLQGLQGEGLRILEDNLGRLLGRGRLGRLRLKNLLPRRWF
jgi:16S rRNA (cytosine1407-C5)-methyltransferase